MIFWRVTSCDRGAVLKGIVLNARFKHPFKTDAPGDVNKTFRKYEQGAMQFGKFFAPDAFH
jgi:hypothetical protein